MSRMRFFGIAIVAAAMLLPTLASAANIQGPRRSALDKLKDGDAIRKRLLLRGGRFEITPTIGFTLNDPFQRNILLGAHMAYHISDSWGLGVTGFYGLPFETGLAEQIKAERAEKVDDGGFSKVELLASVELLYSPLIGKFAMFGRTVVNYDLHILAGVAGAKVTADKAIDDFNPGAVVGIGLRTFMTDGIALNIEVRDYLYAQSTNAVVPDGGGDAEGASEFQNNFAVTIGFGFYFPQQPKLSN